MQPRAHEGRRKFPAVVDLMRVQPVADLLFAFAFGQRVERGRGGQTLGGFALEFCQEGDLFDGQCLMTERQAQTVERLQSLAEMLRRAPRGRRRIIQFVRQPGGKLAQRHQFVVPFVYPRHFAHTVAHDFD